jgi:hypothetical protein
MYNSFQIYNPDNKSFHWDINNVLFILFLIFGLIKIIDISSFSKIADIGLKSIIFLGLLLLYSNIFRKRPLHGKLEGMLIFDSDQIIINNIKIGVNQIKKIFIRTSDYEGKELNSRWVGLFPNFSNGTNNLLDLDLKNGSKIKIFFKIEYENQVEELQPFIITLIQNKILTQIEGEKILHLNNDFIYEKFINELNEKELD